jgi:hypothetical protein
VEDVRARVAAEAGEAGPRLSFFTQRALELLVCALRFERRFATPLPSSAPPIFVLSDIADEEPVRVAGARSAGPLATLLRNVLPLALWTDRLTIGVLLRQPSELHCSRGSLAETPHPWAFDHCECSLCMTMRVTARARDYARAALDLTRGEEGAVSALLDHALWHPRLHARRLTPETFAARVQRARRAHTNTLRAALSPSSGDVRFESEPATPTADDAASSATREKREAAASAAAAASRAVEAEDEDVAEAETARGGAELERARDEMEEEEEESAREASERAPMLLRALGWSAAMRQEAFDAMLAVSATRVREPLPELEFVRCLGDDRDGGGSGGGSSDFLSTLFGQLCSHLRRANVAALRCAPGEVTWRANFAGVLDQGSKGLPGPFRQLLFEISNELTDAAYDAAEARGANALPRRRARRVAAAQQSDDGERSNGGSARGVRPPGSDARRAPPPPGAQQPPQQPPSANAVPLDAELSAGQHDEYELFDDMDAPLGPQAAVPQPLRAFPAAAAAAAAPSPPPQSAPLAAPPLREDAQLQLNAEGESGAGRSAAPQVAYGYSLFIPCPNALNETGESRNKLIVDPSRASPLDLQCFFAFGQLLGVVLRSKCNLDIDLAATFWKLLLDQEELTDRDLRSFDFTAWNNLQFRDATSGEEFSAAEFEAAYEQSLFYTTTLSDGATVVELVPGGAAIPVRYEDRRHYARLAIEARFRECAQQVEKIRKGLLTVVPRAALELLTPRELQLRVCGSARVNIAILKRHTVYAPAAQFNEQSEIVVNFWRVLEEFDDQDRARFLQFVWARSRLPSDMTAVDAPQSKYRMQITITQGRDEMLPLSETCFFNLKLPEYRDIHTLRAKLTLAIRNCTSITF